MRTVLYSFAVLLLAGVGVQAEKQTTEAGQQLIKARRTTKPVVIDGILSAGEWSAAIPLHVNAVKPVEAPGLVPWAGLEGGLNPPDNQDDSSFTIYAMYDADNLYVAVDVADDLIISDNPVLPFLDDDVELFFDGDNQPWDLDTIAWILGWLPDFYGVLPNNEGFQLVTTAGDVSAVYPSPVVVVDWSSKAGLRPRGYLVETRVSLDSINTIDNSWWTNPAMTPADLEGPDPTQSNPPGIPFLPTFHRPEPGDSIGFNVTVGDDDCGWQPGSSDPWQDSWARTDVAPNPSSFVAWDGSSPSWYYADEEAWGTLYLVP